MKYLRLIIILLLIITTTGCVSYNELNELGIIDMMLIDYKDGGYTITVNMITPNKDELENKKTYTSTCNTLNDCLNKLYLSSSKKVTFTHLELMALTPNIKKKNYDEIINLFLNRIDSRNTFSTIIVENTNDLFNYKSNDINDLININHEENGISFIKQFDDVIKDILEMNISYIPRIKIDKEIIIEGYQSIYEENKLLSVNESIGYNFIQNNIKQVVFTTNNISFKLSNNFTKIDINKNKIDLDITNEFQIVTNDSNITDDKEINKICTDKVKEIINSYIKNNTHNYFYTLIEKYDYKYYKENKNKLPSLDFNINVKSAMINNSNIKGGIFNE